MDSFSQMMAAADKNAKKAAREVDRIQTEVDHEKNEVHRQVEAEKQFRIQMQRRKMEREKEMARKKAEREEENRRKNFTIPKRNEQQPPSGKAVNTDALRAVLDRQKAEKEEREKRAEREKQKLMMLRMQANGGKATKKMGKQFGLDVIDLQTRFGGNNQHLEVLQKRKWKEEEEQDAETDKFRSGVFKAVAQKHKNEGALRTGVTGPHRVSTSKSNSLAGLCSRHEKTRDTFSPPKDGKKAGSSRAEQPNVEKKKVQAAAPIDFKSLMAAASDIAEGKSVNLEHLKARPANGGAQKPSSSSAQQAAAAEREKQREKERIREKQQQEKMKEAEKQRYRLEKERERERERARSSASSSSKSRPFDSKLTSSSSSGGTTSSQQNGGGAMKKKEAPAARKPFQKAPTPPPLIPAAIPGKKYLPGDVRYQESMAMMRNGNNGSVANSGTSKDRITAIREAEKQREREREKQRALKRAREEKEFKEYQREQKMRKTTSSSASSSSYSAAKSTTSSSEAKRNYEARRMAELREQQQREKKKKMLKMREEKRSHHQNQHHRSSNDSGRGSLWKGADDYTDEEDDDDEMDDDRYDEYDDSDMDDFIDDTEVDMDGMSRKEFEDTLRMVNRKYDTEKWSRREKAIDVRSMDSNYRRVQSEENFSSRAGILEDLREASKGRSVRL